MKTAHNSNQATHTPLSHSHMAMGPMLSRGCNTKRLQYDLVVCAGGVVWCGMMCVWRGWGGHFSSYCLFFSNAYSVQLPPKLILYILYIIWNIVILELKHIISNHTTSWRLGVVWLCADLWVTGCGRLRSTVSWCKETFVMSGSLHQTWSATRDQGCPIAG